VIAKLAMTINMKYPDLCGKLNKQGMLNATCRRQEIWNPHCICISEERGEMFCSINSLNNPNDLSMENICRCFRLTVVAFGENGKDTIQTPTGNS
jgi:hypothetical protein